MKNIYGLIIISFFLCFTCKAQNILHYATNTNGEVEKRLFPEDSNGGVLFSDIIETDYSADSIMLMVDDYIQSLKSLNNCEVENVSKSGRSCTYNIQANIGKQLWGIELFGSPLFAINRDASHVKFKCVVEIREKKYKYTFFDFETNRNTISGEAKNDGQPNTIHWQRINSLNREEEAYKASHDIKNRKVKEVIYDYEAQKKYETALYYAEFDAIKNIENGLRKLIYSDEFKTFEKKNIDNKTSTNIFSEDKSIYTTYHGCLLTTGNTVFLVGGDSHYEQAALQELKKQIEIDGLWNVTNDINNAHFVLRYYVNLEGRDMAYLTVETPDGRIVETIASKGSNESVSDNREVARSLYLRNVPLLSDRKKCKKQITKKFTR